MPIEIAISYQGTVLIAILVNNAIGGMLSQLTELEASPIEFDEKLWHAVVDRVTVYNDDRLVYSMKDGSEITVML